MGFLDHRLHSSLILIEPDKLTLQKVFTLFILQVYIIVLVAQLYLTLYNPVACSPPGSSVHRILQARIQKWVAISFSREQV